VGLGAAAQQDEVGISARSAAVESLVVTTLTL
jgi:hypothetical protein